MPLSLVGAEKGPRRPRLRRPPFVYFNLRITWSDSRVFNLWKQEFLEAVGEFTHMDVLLRMDYHSSYADLVDPLETGDGDGIFSKRWHQTPTRGPGYNSGVENALKSEPLVSAGRHNAIRSVAS